MIHRSARPPIARTVGSISCRRPGCGRTATLSISYDAANCQIWIDDVGASPSMGQPLCAEHAGRLNPPRGWVVVDRRTGMPDPADRPAERASAVRRGWGRFESTRVDAPRSEPLAPAASTVTPVHMTEAFAATLRAPVAPPTAPPAPPVPPTPPVDAPAEARVPRPAESVEPTAPAAMTAAERRARRRAMQEEIDLLKPKGRMLSRAFGATGHQRSVLSAPLGRADDAAGNTERATDIPAEVAPDAPEPGGGERSTGHGNAPDPV